MSYATALGGAGALREPGTWRAGDGWREPFGDRQRPHPARRQPDQRRLRAERYDLDASNPLRGVEYDGHMLLADGGGAAPAPQPSAPKPPSKPGCLSSITSFFGCAGHAVTHNTVTTHVTHFAGQAVHFVGDVTGINAGIACIQHPSLGGCLKAAAQLGMTAATIASLGSTEAAVDAAVTATEETATATDTDTAASTAARAAGDEGAATGQTLYHGTDLASAERLAAGEPLNTAAATARSGGAPPGFYLATSANDAEYFATLKSGLSGQAAVLRYKVSDTALGRMLGSNSVLRDIPYPTFGMDSP